MSVFSFVIVVNRNETHTVVQAKTRRKTRSIPLVSCVKYYVLFVCPFKMRVFRIRRVYVSLLVEMICSTDKYDEMSCAIKTKTRAVPVV